MKHKFVDELHWIDEQEMLEMTALAQSAPGAIAVNAAILVGWNVLGFPGMLVAVCRYEGGQAGQHAHHPHPQPLFCGRGGRAAAQRPGRRERQRAGHHDRPDPDRPDRLQTLAH